MSSSFLSSLSSLVWIRNRDIIASILIILLLKLCHLDHQDASWMNSSFGGSMNMGNSISATIHLGFYSNITATTTSTTDNVRLANPVSLDIDGDDISEALIVPYLQSTTTPQTTNTPIIFGMQILHLKPLFTTRTSYNNHHYSNKKPFFIPSRMMESVISYIPHDDNHNNNNNNEKNKYNTMMIAPIWMQSHHISLTLSSIYHVQQQQQQNNNNNNKNQEEEEERKKKLQYYCGTSWQDATEQCLTPCPDFHCPKEGERCFADTNCYHPSEDPTNNNNNNNNNHQNPFLIPNDTTTTTTITPHNTLPCITTLWNHGSITLHCYQLLQEKDMDFTDTTTTTTSNNKDSSSSRWKWIQIWNTNPFNHPNPNPNANNNNNNNNIHWEDYNIIISHHQHSIYLAATYYTNNVNVNNHEEEKKDDDTYHSTQQHQDVEEEEEAEMTLYASLNIYTGEINWLHTTNNNIPTTTNHHFNHSDTTKSTNFKEDVVIGMARRRSQLYYRRHHNDDDDDDTSKSCIQQFRSWTLQHALPHVYWNPIIQQHHHHHHPTRMTNSKLLMSHLNNRHPPHHHPSNQQQQQQQQQQRVAQTSSNHQMTQPSSSKKDSQKRNKKLPFARNDHFLKKNYSWLLSKWWLSFLPNNEKETKQQQQQQQQQPKPNNNKSSLSKKQQKSNTNVPENNNNVLIFHNKNGIHVRSLKNGKGVCHITLLQNSLYADINHDGIIDQIQIRSNTNNNNNNMHDETNLYIGDEIVHHMHHHDEKNIPQQNRRRSNHHHEDDPPSCHVLAVSGIPARQQLFQQPLCTNLHQKHHGMNIASPLVIESEDYHDSIHKKDIVFALNHGQIIRYNSYGDVQWDIDNEKIHKYNTKILPTWSSSPNHNKDDPTMTRRSEQKKHYDSASTVLLGGGATCALLDRIDFPIQKFDHQKHPTSQMILASSSTNPVIAAARPIFVAGEDSMALISSGNKGRIMAHTKFPQSSVRQPILTDLNGDGVTDIIIISQDAIWGFIVQLEYSRAHNIFNRIMVGLLFFGIAFAVIVNHTSSSSTKFLAQRSTDLK